MSTPPPPTAMPHDALLAAIVDSSTDAIVSKTLDGTIASWNAAAERLFGYVAVEAIGRTISLVVPPDRLDEEASILERLRRGERVQTFETVRRHRSGRLLDVAVTVSPVRDAQGRIVLASKIARDIGERKNIEAALRDEESIRLLRATLPAIVGPAPASTAACRDRASMCSTSTTTR